MVRNNDGISGCCPVTLSFGGIPKTQEASI